MPEEPEREDYWENPDEPEREPWYAWSRWKWIGGALFLALSVFVIGYGIWDEIDRRPKPIDWPTVRLMVRELPPRTAGYLALAGFISFGPPAGVDLMLGATKAAERWVKRMRAKDRAEALAKGRVEGRAEGRVEGRVEERREIRERLQRVAENNPEVQSILDEWENDDRA
jgi:hypothetical protein